MTYLLYTGRPREVVSILRETADRPPEMKAEYFDAVRVTAEGLSGMRPPTDAIVHNLDYLRTNPSSALPVAQALVALGDKRGAFNIFHGYYFGEGEWATLAPKGGDQDRTTRPLFQPMMAPIWRDAEFNAFLERIGLNEYWRRSGTKPDFRRS
jgi:hypothetical protein